MHRSFMASFAISRFNMIRFSSDLEKWKENIVDSNETNCHEAIAWIESLNAEGNTCTLTALQVRMN